MINSSVLFLATDDLKGSYIQILKRKIKFYIRFVFNRSNINSIKTHFESMHCEEILTTDSVILIRPFRSYLWTSLQPTERAHAVQAHFSWLVQQFGKEQVLSLYRDGAINVVQWVREEHEVSISLQPSRGLGREGELELHLSLDGLVVMRSGFSVLPMLEYGADDQHRYLVVGALQGSRDGADLMRDLTKSMERVLPRAILIAALQGLAEGWALQGVLGVSSGAHVLVGYGRTLARRVGVDYDEIWNQFGAIKTLEKSHWVLPLHPLQRDISEIASKKRAEYRRKTALIHQVFSECCDMARSSALKNS